MDQTLNNIPPSLAGKHRESFAFEVMRDRLPVIITKIIDQLHRDKTEIAAKYGAEALVDVKDITGELAKLKSELVTDKTLLPFTVDYHDIQMWNGSLDEMIANTTEEPTWFSLPWLYVENFMYRKIFEIFLRSRTLKEFDYFQKQKEDGLLQSIEAMTILASHLTNTLKNLDNTEEIKTHLKEMLQICLWSNRCDLSLSAGADRSQKEDPVKMLEFLKPFIVIDQTNDIIEHILECKTRKPEGIRVDIVLDNSGFELFCDFCFAHFLCASKLVKEVYFYVKYIPWYVSDTTIDDFNWVIKTLIETPFLKRLGNICQHYVNDNIWHIQRHKYWTLGYDYSEMEKHDSDLYLRLSKSDLIIFKGDLNYRKLTGDRQWDFTTPFETSLRGFSPSPLCALRTLKCDTIVGLKPGQADAIEKESKKWLVNGEYALVQFTSHIL